MSGVTAAAMSKRPSYWREKTHAMYDRILLATDGSVASEAAEAHAVDLAAHTGATLVVLSVVDERVFGAYPGDEYVHEREGLEAALVTEAEEAIAAVETVADARDVPVRTLLRHGDPVEEILDAIEHEAVELAIVGTSRAAGSYPELLGSVAERVTHRADVPVMIVKTA
ncbi:MAG: universal stress protein [Halobacteriota archaeon]